MDSPCIFCIKQQIVGTPGVPPDRILTEYKYWWLILQPTEKRQKTKQAAGLLATKRHVDNVSQVNQNEAIELFEIVKAAAEDLCKAVGTTYAGQETAGFNQGPDAGQTILHAHVHILPVSESDPPELKIRGGIGGAFEALRKERLARKEHATKTKTHT